jgi:hypothetical protein
MKALRILLMTLTLTSHLTVFASTQSGLDRDHNANKVEQMIKLTSPNEWQKWRVTNDGVMGGLSKGRVIFDNDSSRFTGEISLENNGGFSSVYRPISPLSSDVKKVRVDLFGDGLTYQLRFSVIINGYRVAYKHEFETMQNQRQTIELNISDFKASFRGRIIGNAPKLQAPYIRQVGFLVTNKQPSTFSLNLYRIDFLKAQDKENENK